MEPVRGPMVSTMLLERDIDLVLVCASNQNPGVAARTFRLLIIDITAEASAVVEASGSARAA